MNKQNRKRFFFWFEGYGAQGVVGWVSKGKDEGGEGW